ncbi:helix-turn-helix domain-containing protein [uncultured Porticoccus sp.]|uniref:helix-turn-helix domain-containing protein n=1 Tax=uncultured Porticoccus sp. TaxID=1256050 RepID=UPI00260BA670|nr:helix-turn-helix domain-containing protein [uncultured Porticoccus sp.]
MSQPETDSSPDAVSSPSLRDATAHFQRRLVSEALRRCDGNQSRAARESGLDRGNFSWLIKRLGVNEQPL